jgi:hypothetical protein
MVKNKYGFENYTRGQVIRPELWDNHPYLLCSGCGQRFVEPRQLNRIVVIDNVTWGECPICRTVLDLTSIMVTPDPNVKPPITD